MLADCLLFYYLYMILTNFHRVLYKGLQSIWMTATGSKDKMKYCIVLVDSEHGWMDNFLIYSMELPVVHMISIFPTRNYP